MTGRRTVATQGGEIVATIVPIPSPTQVVATAASVLGVNGWSRLAVAGATSVDPETTLRALAVQSPIFLHTCYDTAVAALSR